MNFNKQIIKLWEDHLTEVQEWYGDKDILAPMLYPELSKNSLLTIGINPSFSEDAIKKLIKDNPIPDIWDFYIFKNRYINAQSWIEFETTAREKYSYYSRFKELRDHLRLPWSHIDLYYIRATNQKQFLNRLRHYPDLKKSQLDLTKKIVTNLSPKMILVANSKGVLEYRAFFDNDIEWSEEKGCYLSTIDDQNIPTHFSGQLKYLDKESFRRLKWGMKNSLD